MGKVSSVIGLKAATLAILYETDHRPNNPYTLSLVSRTALGAKHKVSVFRPPSLILLYHDIRDGSFDFLLQRKDLLLISWSGVMSFLFNRSRVISQCS